MPAGGELAAKLARARQRSQDYDNDVSTVLAPSSPPRSAPKEASSPAVTKTLPAASLPEPPERTTESSDGDVDVSNLSNLTDLSQTPPAPTPSFAASPGALQSENKKLLELLKEKDTEIRDLKKKLAQEETRIKYVTATGEREELQLHDRLRHESHEKWMDSPTATDMAAFAAVLALIGAAACAARRDARRKRNGHEGARRMGGGGEHGGRMGADGSGMEGFRILRGRGGGSGSYATVVPLPLAMMGGGGHGFRPVSVFERCPWVERLPLHPSLMSWAPDRVRAIRVQLARLQVQLDAVHAERWTLLELLGAGAMGAVVKARDKRLLSFVAIKAVFPRPQPAHHGGGMAAAGGGFFYDFVAAGGGGAAEGSAEALAALSPRSEGGSEGGGDTDALLGAGNGPDSTRSPQGKGGQGDGSAAASPSPIESGGAPQLLPTEQALLKREAIAMQVPAFSSCDTVTGLLLYCFYTLLYCYY